jgi:hypothetical protein
MKMKRFLAAHAPQHWLTAKSETSLEKVIVKLVPEKIFRKHYPAAIELFLFCTVFPIFSSTS